MGLFGGLLSSGLGMFLGGPVGAVLGTSLLGGGAAASGRKTSEALSRLKQNPAMEQADAENKATAATNAKAAMRRRARMASSLLATGGSGTQGSPPTSSVLAYGKDKLGQ